MMEEIAVTAMSAGAGAAVPTGPPESGSALALPPPENSGTALFAARPSLIRAMNEQLLLEHIRQRGPCSRAELARVSGLSKPTVSLALENVERAGLVRIAGQRTGVPGRSARLYEIRPDAGLVLGLDIGSSTSAARSPTCPGRSGPVSRCGPTPPASAAGSPSSSGSPTCCARTWASRGRRSRRP